MGYLACAIVAATLIYVEHPILALIVFCIGVVTISEN